MTMLLSVGDLVTFIDFVGEGHHHKHWPTGFQITHGHVGEIIHVDREWKDTPFSDGSVLKGMPVRYQVSWRAGWFYKMMEDAYGYVVPDYVKESCGPVEWAHKLHVVKNPNGKEVERLEDIKKVTEEILHTRPWTDVLKGITVESPVVAWARKTHPRKEDEGRLPGDVAYVFRKAAAYDWIASHYRSTGVESLQQRYQLLRDAALNEVVQKLTEEGMDLSYSRASNTTVGKEKHTMAAPKTAAATKVEPKEEKKKAAPAKAAKPVAKASGSAGGRRVDGNQVTQVLRETDPTPKAICKAMLEAFGVKLDPKRIEDAPNPGIMKMRAGNLVRGQLRREDRLA